MNGSAINTLSQAETEDLLSSNMLILEVQKESQSLSPHFLDVLLVEVDEKMKKDSNIHQHLADSLSALQGSEKIGTSELSSAVQSEIDEVASFNDNTSLSVTTPLLSLSPSLTPLYEDRAEKNQGTQTDTSSGLLASDSLQRRCFSISDKPDGFRSVGPSPPPPRSKSVAISGMYNKRRSATLGQRGTLSSSDVPGVPHDSSTDDQVTALELGTNRFTTTSKKKTRPKSAPVVRPDTLDIMDNNRTVHSGDSTLPRRNIIHPPISPSDPLSLSARVNHLSGRPQPISPPALTSLHKSRNVPHFTVHSRPLLPGPEYCIPTSCLTQEPSRSPLPEAGDRGKASKIRSRTWTEPQKNFRNRQGMFNGSVTSQKFSESGHSSTLPRRRRVKSSSSQSQSNNTIDTHSTVSSHSSRIGSMGSSSGQNTPHIPSTPTFPRDIIEPIIHTKQSSGDSGDKLVVFSPFFSFLFSLFSFSFILYFSIPNLVKCLSNK